MKICLIISSFLVFGLTPSAKSHKLKDNCEKKLHPDFTGKSQFSKSASGEEHTAFWINKGKSFVKNQSNRLTNTKKAKNVILFIGDGMSLSTIAATRGYIKGEETQLSFEKFPYTGLSKTYCVDRVVPDSAVTSTSYLCGVKANYGTIGVNAKVSVGNCVSTKNKSNYVYSIGKWAMDAGKSAGLVTTTRVTHASPAGMYAHVADRQWENDFRVERDCGKNNGIDDIAVQMIHGSVGSRLKVIMGGGKENFQSKPVGRRSDGKDLLNEYLSQSKRNAFVETWSELKKIDIKSADRLLGLFHKSHLEYYLDAQEKGFDQPTLEEMTKKTIEFMKDDENGFFLFVEGGRIDTAHHKNEAKLALDETEQLSRAVSAARKMTNEDDTLIVVTSDHSHPFTYSGYADRGTKPTGVAGVADDGIPYMTLSYANGPKFDEYFDTKNNRRIDPSVITKKGNHAAWPSTVLHKAETHGGEDVAVYASGPWAHLFTGVYEQNAIPHMLAYASCIGDGLKLCDK